jgi:hypothetical protein
MMGKVKKPRGQCRDGKYREEYEDGTFSGCGRWLTAEDFEAHRVQRNDVDGYARRCLTDDELLLAGWVHYGDGNWGSPKRQHDMVRQHIARHRMERQQ